MLWAPPANMTSVSPRRMVSAEWHTARQLETQPAMKFATGPSAPQIAAARDAATVRIGVFRIVAVVSHRRGHKRPGSYLPLTVAWATRPASSCN